MLWCKKLNQWTTKYYLMKVTNDVNTDFHNDTNVFNVDWSLLTATSIR